MLCGNRQNWCQEEVFSDFSCATLNFHQRILSHPIDDDEIWTRISAKRKEMLGQSSLRLKATLPRHMYKVRFDLPGSPAPVRAGSDVGNENQDWEETSDDNKEGVKSTHRHARYFKIGITVFRVFLNSEKHVKHRQGDAQRLVQGWRVWRTTRFSKARES